MRRREEMAAKKIKEQEEMSARRREKSNVSQNEHKKTPIDEADNSNKILKIGYNDGRKQLVSKQET